MVDPAERKWRIAFLVVLALFAGYAGALIYRTTFIVDDERYFCLLDDAMISMRYARNLVDGHGLVWNPGGERVEGFTNPLWTGAMAAVHLLPLPESKVSLVVQVLGVGLLLGNLLLVRRIAAFLSGNAPAAKKWGQAPRTATECLVVSELPRSQSPFLRGPAVWLGAVVLTAFYLPLNVWTLGGMEVGAATLLVSGVVWIALRSVAEGRFSRSVHGLLALGVWIRMDLLVPAIVVWAWLIWGDARHRRWHCVLGLLAMGVSLGAQTALRVAYYGDWLPNTYYLKMSGYPALLRLARGALVLWDFVRHVNPVLFFLPLTILLLRRDRYIVLPALVFVGQVGYSVYVGGDAWEFWGGANRYLSIAMPLFFVLFCCAVDALAACVTQHLPSPSGRGAGSEGSTLLPSRACGRGAIVAVVVLLALPNFNLLKGPASLREWALIDSPKLTERNAEMVRRALTLRAVTRPDAKVALVWAGILPYFADRPTIDISGKNDRHIARLPMHRAPVGPGYRYFLPGHLKWDYAYSIRALRPDVVMQTEYPPGEAEPYLVGAYERVMLDGYDFHLRRRSSEILWERLPATYRSVRGVGGGGGGGIRGWGGEEAHGDAGLGRGGNLFVDPIAGGAREITAIPASTGPPAAFSASSRRP